jgi:CheY-like chemotaxis protein
MKLLNSTAETACSLASELIHKGQYEAAADVLGDFWQGIGNRPNVEKLSPPVAADVILQCGVLSGWLGTTHAVPDAQARAKDLIFEALRSFEDQKKVSEARYELGICYWREGAYEEARIILKQALEGATDILRAKILIRRTIVENCTGRYHDAWEILREAQGFFESCNDALKGKWHGQMAIVLHRLALTEKREDYADRAIIEFTAAIYHYEQAGNTRYAAINLNNLACLLYPIGRHQEAHHSLERAIQILQRLDDTGLIAQVKETQARVLISEGRYEEASHTINETLLILEQGREYALLTDALTVQGVALSRLGNYERSISILKQAMKLAEDSGSFVNAGLAALTLIEEHYKRLSETELHTIYRRANRLLKDTQDIEYIFRLQEAASIVIDRVLGPQLTDKNFNLTKAVRDYEAKFIEQALEMTGGLVSRAAKLLGFKHHGSLTSLLKKKHRHLQKKRTPPTPRKATIRNSSRAAYRAKTITILHVEDHKVVADAVKETLEAEGLRVVTCVDGAMAVNKLSSQVTYDLLIVDNHLPNVNGMEIARYARQLPHRKDTPIIMFTASEAQGEAREAGVDVYLKKPHDVKRLVKVVSSLITRGAEG